MTKRKGMVSYLWHKVLYICLGPATNPSPLALSLLVCDSHNKSYPSRLTLANMPITPSSPSSS